MSERKKEWNEYEINILLMFHLIKHPVNGKQELQLMDKEYI